MSPHGGALRAWGIVRYRTGKPCCRGHLSERYACNGACVECVRENAAEDRAEHRRKTQTDALTGVWFGSQGTSP